MSNGYFPLASGAITLVRYCTGFLQNRFALLGNRSSLPEQAAAKPIREPIDVDEHTKVLVGVASSHAPAKVVQEGNLIVLRADLRRPLVGPNRGRYARRGEAGGEGGQSTTSQPRLPR